MRRSEPADAPCSRTAVPQASFLEAFTQERRDGGPVDATSSTVTIRGWRWSLPGVNGNPRNLPSVVSSPSARNAQEIRPSAQSQILRQPQARWIGRCRTCADAEAPRRCIAVGVGVLPSHRVPPGIIRSRQTAELIRAVGSRHRQVGRKRVGRGRQTPSGEGSRSELQTVMAVDTSGARPSYRRG